MCVSWEIVRSYKQFVDKITKDGLPKFISFDHDLASNHYPTTDEDYEKPIDYDVYREKTGYHCAMWLIDYCHSRSLSLPDWQVHSLNPVGKVNIQQALTRYKEREELCKKDLTPEAKNTP